MSSPATNDTDSNVDNDSNVDAPLSETSSSSSVAVLVQTADRATRRPPLRSLPAGDDRRSPPNSPRLGRDQRRQIVGVPAPVGHNPRVVSVPIPAALEVARSRQLSVGTPGPVPLTQHATESSYDMWKPWQSQHPPDEAGHEPLCPVAPCHCFFWRPPPLLTFPTHAQRSASAEAQLLAFSPVLTPPKRTRLPERRSWPPTDDGRTSRRPAARSIAAPLQQVALQPPITSASAATSALPYTYAPPGFSVTSGFRFGDATPPPTRVVQTSDDRWPWQVPVHVIMTPANPDPDTIQRRRGTGPRPHSHDHGHGHDVNVAALVAEWHRRAGQPG